MVMKVLRWWQGLWPGPGPEKDEPHGVCQGLI